MPNQQSEKMLRELNRKAKEFAEKSTRLSNQLEEAEAFLQEMPGKLEVSVGEGWGQLSFSRCQSGWRLWYGSEQDGELVTEASVETKAHAASLLPELVNRLFAVVSERLEQVDAGLTALKDVPFLDNESEDE